MRLKILGRIEEDQSPRFPHISLFLFGYQNICKVAQITAKDSIRFLYKVEVEAVQFSNLLAEFHALDLSPAACSMCLL